MLFNCKHSILTIFLVVFCLSVFSNSATGADLSDYKIEFNKENIKYRPLGKEKIASNKVNNRQVLIKLHGSADVDRIAALGCEILTTPEIIR